MMSPSAVASAAVAARNDRARAGASAVAAVAMEGRCFRTIADRHQQNNTVHSQSSFETIN
jgi:hypothetical protein